MGNSILVTGGTGSFGRAFIKLLLKQSTFQKIIVFSRDEHKQEQMAAELNDDRLRFFIGDVRDKDRLKLAIQDCIYIVHAAALKIVPAGEYNPQEFIKTNIMGAWNLVDALVSDRSRTFTKVIALSTDKAVNPVNLYGATKLCMEKLLLASNSLVGMNRTIQFSVCRYGNVANSNGSVIKKFEQQIKDGKSLTVTNIDMTRFWIELEEAAQFVYNAIARMKGGEVFIPEMPSFRIIDLVEAFRMKAGEKWAGFNIAGIREGEKLHEQIDENRFSNSNIDWLTSDDLLHKLTAFGINFDGKD